MYVIVGFGLSLFIQFEASVDTRDPTSRPPQFVTLLNPQYHLKPFVSETSFPKMARGNKGMGPNRSSSRSGTVGEIPAQTLGSCGCLVQEHLEKAWAGHKSGTSQFKGRWQHLWLLICKGTPNRPTWSSSAGKLSLFWGGWRGTISGQTGTVATTSRNHQFVPSKLLQAAATDVFSILLIVRRAHSMQSEPAEICSANCVAYSVTHSQERSWMYVQHMVHMGTSKNMQTTCGAG